MLVYIGTPIGGTTIEYGYFQSILDAVPFLKSKGHSVHVEVLPQECYIQHARNILTQKFLASGYDVLVFIDSDISFHPQDLLTLVECRKKIACGIYPYKEDKEGYPVRIKYSPTGTYIEDLGLIELEGAATGFLKMDREVLEKLCVPDKLILENSRNGVREYYNIFECKQIGKEWFGEDYNFSRLCIEAGYSIWAIPNMDFLHIGAKAYPGNYEKFVLKSLGRV